MKAGCLDQAEALRGELEDKFRAANLQPPEWPVEPLRSNSVDGERAVSNEEADRTLRIQQRVRFVEARDGVALAWATVGSDDQPTLVKAANWLSHLELDWEAPIWSPLFRSLARHRRLIRYDERGCGLSDWNVPEISFDTFVADLEAVVDAAGLDRFPLLGISQGASVSIEYAVRHPHRVSHLILFGGYPAGWRHLATPEEAREREAIMVLIEAGWGRDDPAYRHLFSQTFMPADGSTVRVVNDTLSIRNSIVDHVGPGQDCAHSSGGSVNIQGSLIGDGSCGVTAGVNGNLVGDPMLAALADNGGPTQTMALTPISPAIDAGDDSNCAADPVSGVDQRGVSRPQGAHCDMGAYELGDGNFSDGFDGS